MVRQEFEDVVKALRVLELPAQELADGMKLIPGEIFSQKFFHRITTQQILNGKEGARHEFCDGLIETRNNDALAWVLVATELTNKSYIADFIIQEIDKVVDKAGTAMIMEKKRILKVYEDKLESVRLLQDHTKSVALNSDNENFFIGDWPDHGGTTIFQHSDSLDLVSPIQNLTNGPTGCLCLYGMAGTGKTTLAVFTIRKTMAKLLRSRHCSYVKGVIWLNVCQLSMADPFDEDGFIHHVTCLLEQSGLIGHQPGTLKQRINDQGQILLFVLDDIANIGVTRAMSKLGSLIRVIAITRNPRKAAYENAWFKCTTIELPVLTDEAVLSMLVDFYGLDKKPGLDRLIKLPRLAKTCLGLPILASVVNQQFKKLTSKVNINEMYWALIRGTEQIAKAKVRSDKLINLCPNALSTIELLFTTAPEFERIARKVLATFLLFDPGEAVNLADLQILWHDDSEDKSRDRCSIALDASLLQASVGNKSYTLHDLLFQSVFKLISGKSDLTDSVRSETKRLILSDLLTGRTNVLFQAIENDRPKIVAILNDFADRAKLTEMILENDAAALKFLHKKWNSHKQWLIDSGTRNESCLLSKALCCLTETVKHVEAVQTFVSSWSLDFEDGYKWYENLLFCAIHYLCYGLAMLIIEKQSASSQLWRSVDYEGSTGLVFAIDHAASINIISKLVKLVDVNVPNKRGETALRRAMLFSDIKIVKALANEASLDANIRAKDGYTPLHIAIGHGRRELVEFLVGECGADVTLTVENKHANALEFAVMRRQPKIAKWLIENTSATMTLLTFNHALENEELSNILLQKRKQLLRDDRDEDLKNRVEISFKKIPALSSRLSNQSLLQQIRSVEEAGFNPLIFGCAFKNVVMVEEVLKTGRAKFEDDAVSALIMACEVGSFSIAEMLILHGANVNWQQRDKTTALIKACGNGQLNIVRLLLENNADANMPTTEGATALQFACQENHLEVVELLIRHGANVNAESNNGDTALHSASWNGALEIVKLLLQHYAKFDHQNKSLDSPLLTACAKEHIEIAKELVLNGANVNLADNCLATPLHAASLKGNLALTTFLLDHSASVDIHDIDGRTSLFIACHYGFSAIAKLLLDRGADVDAKTNLQITALHVASTKGFTDVVELLLSRGADVNLRQQDGKTALHIATTFGYLKIVRLLLAAGADINIASLFGTPLEISIRIGNYDIFKLLAQDLALGQNNTALTVAAEHSRLKYLEHLLDLGMNVNNQKPDGVTALHVSSFIGDIDIVRRLLKETNINVDMRRLVDGATALHLAVNQGKDKIVEMLLAKGADVEALYGQGLTSLHLAVDAGEQKVVDLLLAKGANLEKLFADGSALSIAILKSNEKMVEYLLEKGAKVNETVLVDKGWTPLHQACAVDGSVNIVQMLIEHGADPSITAKDGRTAMEIARAQKNSGVIELFGL